MENLLLKIIYQDNDLLVIDKPAGLIVHPAHLGQKGTLIDQLISQFPEIEKVGDDPLRPGLVHRLDKDTSGLMVIAKNNQAFAYLKKQFAAAAKSFGGPPQERKVIKGYLALVTGQVKDQKGTITKAISLSKKDRKKRAALLDEKSKPALTKYQVIKTFKNYTLLKVSPATGRTHQIRVHLASIGHPIAGDKQYKFKRQSCPENLFRQFLHAAYLKFRLADGKMMEFKSELPQDLKEVLNSLEKSHE